MVRLAQREGVKPTARTFATTPKTVRLWLRRYQADDYAGLKEWSRAPNHPAPPTRDTSGSTDRQRPERSPSRFSAEQTCAGQPEGVECWKELANQSQC